MFLGGHHAYLRRGHPDSLTGHARPLQFRSTLNFRNNAADNGV